MKTRSQLVADTLDRVVHFLRTGESMAGCAFCGGNFPNATVDDVRTHVAACPDHPMRALEAELATVRTRLEFFRPKCAQCDAPLDVHPYQCKLYGLCDKCAGDVDAGDPREPIAPDLTVLEVPNGGQVDLSQVKTRYIAVRVKAESSGTTGGAIFVTPDDFAKPRCPGCGHVECAINSEGCAAGQCACEALKRPDPATWLGNLKDATIAFGPDLEMEPSKTVVTLGISSVKVETKPLPANECPFCHGELHDPNPEKNAGLCPEIPF